MQQVVYGSVKILLSIFSFKSCGNEYFDVNEQLLEIAFGFGNRSPCNFRDKVWFKKIN